MLKKPDLDDHPKSPINKEETSVINEIHKEIKFSLEFLLSKISNRGQSSANYNSNASAQPKKQNSSSKNNQNSSSLLKSVLLNPEHVLTFNAKNRAAPSLQH